MGKSMVSCRFSLKSTHWLKENNLFLFMCRRHEELAMRINIWNTKSSGFLSHPFGYLCTPSIKINSPKILSATCSGWLRNPAPVDTHHIVYRVSTILLVMQDSCPSTVVLMPEFFAKLCFREIPGTEYLRFPSTKSFGIFFLVLLPLQWAQLRMAWS